MRHHSLPLLVLILLTALLGATRPTQAAGYYYSDVPHYDQNWFAGDGDCLPNSVTQVLGWHDGHGWPRLIAGGCNDYAKNPGGVHATMNRVKDVMNWWDIGGWVIWDGIWGTIGDRVRDTAIGLDPGAFWWTDDDNFTSWSDMKEQINHYSPMMLLTVPPLVVTAYFGTLQDGDPAVSAAVSGISIGGHSMCMFGYSENVYKVNAEARWVIVDTGWDKTAPAWINYDTWLADYYTVEFHAQGVATPFDPIAAPSSVVASDGDYSDRVQVDWNHVTGASVYEVWRSEKNDPQTATLLLTTASDWCHDTGAIPSVTYYYWVQAVYACGGSSGKSLFSNSDAGYLTCRSDISPRYNDQHGPAEGSGSFNVEASPYCAWTVSTTNSWIHLDTTNGAGTKTIRYAIDAHPGARQRGGHIQVDRNFFGVLQNGNDYFTNAVTLRGAYLSVTGETITATADLGEPYHLGRPPKQSVWWRWQAPVSGRFGIALSGGTYSRLAVYTGSTLASLTPVGDSNDYPYDRTIFTVNAGTLYAIAVDGDVASNFYFQLAPVSVNDNFEDRIPLNIFASGSNTFCSTQWGETTSGNASRRSAWWSWTAPYSGPVSISTAGSDFDTSLKVSTGSSINYLMLVAQNDNDPDAAPTLTSRVTFNAIAGVTYQIAVDGIGGAAGNIALQVEDQNDDFANRIELSGSTAKAGGGNRLATSETDEPGHGGSLGGKSVWWSWTAPASGLARITTAGSSFDTVLGIYTGSTVGALSLVASNDDQVVPHINTNQQAGVSFDAVAGTTYQIAVDGQYGRVLIIPQGWVWRTDSGAIVLSVALTATNDGFARRTTLAGTAVQVTNLNLNASKEEGEANHAGNAGGKSVWFSWTAPAAGTVRLSTAGSDFDTLLAVYDGSSVSNLTLIAASDDVSPYANTSELCFAVSAGTTYQIVVDGKDGAAGTFNLYLVMPANDSFQNRQVLAGTMVNIPNLNLNTTKEAGEPNHADNVGGRSAWWAWTAPMSGSVKVTTLGSTFDTLLAVYTGDTITNLTLVADNDDVSGGGGISRVAFNALAGTTYQIAVDGYNGATGVVALHVTVPANDNFADQVVLAGSVLNVTNLNLGATREEGEPNHAGREGSHSVWYSWRPPVTGWARITTAGSDFNTLLAVYTGDVINELFAVDSNDDATKSTRTSRVGFAALAGTDYMIAVDGREGDAGLIALHVTLGPVNDDFTNALALTGAVVNVTGWNTNALKDASEPNHAGLPGGKSVWWAWIAPASGWVSVATTGSSFDTLLGIYTGATPSSLRPVASNDDEPSGAKTSRLVFNASAGTTYVIAVDGYVGAYGAIALQLAMPANDDFDHRASLLGAAVTATAGNHNATRQPDEPTPAANAGGKSVWWQWIAPASGPVWVATFGSSFDTLLGVYTGFATTNLVLLASNDDYPGRADGASALQFNAVAGTAYQIAVDGRDGAVGQIILNITNYLTLGEAVEAADLTWTTGGEVPWFGQPNTRHDGVDAAQSGTLEPFQSSWMETSITGPATVTFWWKNPLRSDWLQLFVDGSYHSAIGADAEWRQQLVNLPAGTHTLTWTFFKYGSGTGSAWLDEVIVTDATLQPPAVIVPPASQCVADGTNVFFEVALTGELPFACQWQRDGTNLVNTGLIFGVTGQRLDIFSASFGEVGEYRVVVTNAWGAVTSAVAVLTVAPSTPWVSWFYASFDAGLGAPVDLTGGFAGTTPLAFQWSRDGDNLVNGTNGTLHLDAAAATDAGNYRVVITNLYGAVTSSVMQLTISSNPPVITGDLTNQKVSLGATLDFCIHYGGTLPISFHWQKNGRKMESQPGSCLDLPSATEADTGYYQVVLSNAFGTATSMVALLVVGEINPLAAAVDAPELSFTTFGNADWFAQTTNTYDGTNAIQSGGIADQQASWLRSQVVGPGTLSFWWSVSSEAGNDRLEYWVDGFYGGQHSGAGNWQQRIVGIPPGTNQIVWCYSKNDSSSAGSDAAWLDRVSFRPQPTEIVLNPALDSDALVFTNTRGLWIPQTAVTHDGVDAAEAQAGPDGFSELITEVQGPGALRFWWKQDEISSGAFAFYVNDSRSAEITIPGDWSEVILALDPGPNTLRWSASNPTAPGHLDEVRFQYSPLAPPIFAVEPTNATVLVGETIHLPALATGPGPMSYRLLFNGSEFDYLPDGDTNGVTFHVLANSINLAGQYWVVACNLSGCVTSAPAAITVHSPAKVVVGPQPKWVLKRRTITLSAVADGDAPLDYQWLQDGTPIPGATNATLQSVNARYEQSGNYSVRVSNPYGTNTSATARVIVAPVLYTARNLGCLATNLAYDPTSTAYDVNNLGLVVGVTSVDERVNAVRGLNTHAFLWFDPRYEYLPNGAMFDLDNRDRIDTALWSGTSGAYGVNDRGEVVGRYEHRTNSMDGYARAVIWHPNINTMYPFIGVSPNPRSLHPTDHWVPDSTAVRISERGHIAVQTGNIYVLANYGYLLAPNPYNSSYTSIYLGNGFNEPRAVNNSGLLVGNSRECIECNEPFRYDGAFKRGAGVLSTNFPEFSTQGYYAVNDLGVIAGIYTTNAPGGGTVNHVFLEYPDGRIVLTPGGSGVEVQDLNNHNQMVGGAYGGVLYTDGRWFALNDLIPGGGTYVQHAHAINDRGWIAGQALFPGVGYRACLLTPTGYGDNHAPLAADDGIQLNRPQFFQIPVAALLANDTDADNDEIHLFRVGDSNGVTQAGGTVQLSGKTILYSPSANPGNDSFTYAVTDGNGGEATARVTITFDPLAPALLRVINPPEPQADGTIRLSGQTPPRWTVFIYQSANIAAPYWTRDETLTTPESGQWSTTRPAMVNGVRVFYKVEIHEPWF